MRTEEFVMRGKTPSGKQEVLNFSGLKPGYAYRLVEFQIYPSKSIGTTNYELAATLTAAKTFEDPENPDFSNQGLIGTINVIGSDIISGRPYQGPLVVINDTFLITQNLIIAVIDTQAGVPMDVNWQCKFMPVKMSNAEAAVTNYKQFLISDN